MGQIANRNEIRSSRRERTGISTQPADSQTRLRRFHRRNLPPPPEPLLGWNCPLARALPTFCPWRTELSWFVVLALGVAGRRAIVAASPARSARIALR